MNSDYPKRSVAAGTIHREVDPFALYRHLTGGAPDTALLESRDGNGKNNTQSLLLVRSALRIEGYGRRVKVTPLTDAGRSVLESQHDRLVKVGTANSEGDSLVIEFPPLDGNASEEERLLANGPLDILRTFAFGWNGQEKTPILLTGMLGYDFLETFEKLPPPKRDGLNTPDLLFELPEVLVRVDHLHREVQVQVHSYGNRKPDDKALAEVVNAVQAFPEMDTASVFTQVPEKMPSGFHVDLDDSAYRAIVELMKRHIVAGDVFQIVPSRTFSLPCRDAMQAYHALRDLNPSPYLFYLADRDFTLFGSSPETCVRVAGNPRKVTLFPIAGTRPRGRNGDGSLDVDLDNRLEAELKLHGKELAEHMMLVDLARNDVARISNPGTRRVSRLLEIERYSHVMHLVSRVEGTLRDGYDALHAYLATMTMGTLTGAPKVEAARLLRKHEADRRGPYGGAVGYLTSEGILDTAIVIRSAVVLSGIAHVRAGAGIVFDSQPQAEADETRSKANAVLQAIALSEGGR
ncbi:MAG: anthranilate synthase component 1 [bacterium]